MVLCHNSHSSYCKKLINPNDNDNIYEWEIRIQNKSRDKFIGNGGAVIGIHSFENCEMILDNVFAGFDNQHPQSSRYWGVSSDGWIHSNTNNGAGVNVIKRWQTWDVIKMILNTKDKSLKYCVNDIDYGIVFRGMEFFEKTYMVLTGQDVYFYLYSFKCFDIQQY